MDPLHLCSHPCDLELCSILALLALFKKKNQKLKNSGEVATETVKYLTLFTASLDKNQIYFLVKKTSSTHFMCTDSGRFIAAHWNKAFRMCCSEGNILTIFSCLPPVSFTHSEIFHSCSWYFPGQKEPRHLCLLPCVQISSSRGCKGPCVPKDPQMWVWMCWGWAWVTADTWEQVKCPLLVQLREKHLVFLCKNLLLQMHTWLSLPSKLLI